MVPCTILVVDDHPLMANATKELLEEMPGVTVIGIAKSGKAGLEFLEHQKPDMVFLDVLLPDMSGPEVVSRIKQLYPDIRVVIFSGVDLTELIPKLVELKVSGVISKETGSNAIKNIVTCILDGQLVLPQTGTISVQPPAVQTNGELTAEEVNIMTMIVKGYTQEQIAEQIYMSKRSVDNYQRRIYEKLGVKGRVQAIELFIRSKYYLGAIQNK